MNLEFAVFEVFLIITAGNVVRLLFVFYKLFQIFAIL